MEINDYISRMYEFTTKFTKLSLNNFRYYLRIAGTDIIVRRITKGEYKEALGSAYIFDSTDVIKNTEEVFKKRLVINRTLLTESYKSTVNDIDAYTNEDFYKIGDQIEFTSRGIQFKYKIVGIDQHDPHNKLLYKLTLSGFEEFIK